MSLQVKIEMNCMPTAHGNAQNINDNSKKNESWYGMNCTVTKIHKKHDKNQERKVMVNKNRIEKQTVVLFLHFNSSFYSEVVIIRDNIFIDDMFYH